MDSTNQLIAEVKRRIELEARKPLTVSIMGQTGVGKSSLINALFGTNLATDPVRPCTKEIERIVVGGESDEELWFYDLPGIGESVTADAAYICDYRERLMDSDVVLWAIHADNRSVAADREAFCLLLDGCSRQHKEELVSKLTIVLTKADLLCPPPWILAKIGSFGIFAASRDTTDVIDRKCAYFQQTFLDQFGDMIISQTYNDGSFSVADSRFTCDPHMISYRGYLTPDKLAALKDRYPAHSAVFERLYANYQVIPCSSLFRFNLAQLFTVVLNKLQLSAVGRFEKFADNRIMNQVPLREALRLCNMVVFDAEKKRVVFDMATADMGR